MYRNNKNATSIKDRVSNESTDAANAALSKALPPPLAEYLQPFAINHNAALKPGYKVPIEEEGEERRYRHDDADGHHRRVELGVHIAHKAGQHVQIREHLCVARKEVERGRAAGTVVAAHEHFNTTAMGKEMQISPSPSLSMRCNTYHSGLCQLTRTRLQ